MDSAGKGLQKWAGYVLVVAFGFLPLFFASSVTAPFEYTKVLIVAGALGIGLILYALSVLRLGKMSLRITTPVWAFGGVFLCTLLSALLSGDLHDALVGDVLSTGTVMFVGILFLSMLMWVILSPQKTVIMHLYVALAASALILVFFHVLRLIGGVDFLTFGIFTDAVSSPIGGWNDLALFLGLVVVLAIIALEQLRLTKLGKILFAVVAVLAVLMLTVINFSAVWYVLGVVSLVVLVYTLGKNRFGSTPALPQTKESATSFLLPLIVCIVSLLFILGGSLFGAFISKYTDISYVEVRPSLGATIDVARSVYGENAFLGIGANKFVDAWRLYKDAGINNTIFWNTNFVAGSGYITTFFVTTGILGGLAWLAFLGTFLYVGVRNLLRLPDTDRIWFFIATSSFVTAVYIWGMSLLYVPNAVILLLGALCTGLTLVAQNALQPDRVKTFSIEGNKRAGFVLTLAVMVVIIGSVSGVYNLGRHYASVVIFNQSIQMLGEGVSIDDVEQKVGTAFQLSPTDVAARAIAEYEVAKMQALLASEDAGVDGEQRFRAAITNGINAGQQARDLDPGEPQNWAVLGSLYTLLVPLNIEGSYDRAKLNLEKARELDPQNPARNLALAALESRNANIEGARNEAVEAVRKKSNYTDALFFLGQLEIAAGDVEAAVNATRAIISIEPNNPARYYQLGVLEISRNNNQGAIDALEAALRLDQNFANAMYFLAFAYDAEKRTDDAKRLLERVLELNPDNTEVQSLLGTLAANGSLRTNLPAEQLTTETDEITENTDTNAAITEQDVDSPLVTPVNAVPAGNTETE